MTAMYEVTRSGRCIISPSQVNEWTTTRLLLVPGPCSGVPWSLFVPIDLTYLHHERPAVVIERSFEALCFSLLVLVKRKGKGRGGGCVYCALRVRLDLT